MLGGGYVTETCVDQHPMEHPLGAGCLGDRGHIDDRRLFSRIVLHEINGLSTDPTLGKRVLGPPFLRHADVPDHHDGLHPCDHAHFQQNTERSRRPAEESEGVHRPHGAGFHGARLDQLGPQHRRFGGLRPLHGQEAARCGLPAPGGHGLPGAGNVLAFGAFRLGAAPRSDPQTLSRKGNRHHSDHRNDLSSLQPPPRPCSPDSYGDRRPPDAPEEGGGDRGIPRCDEGCRLRAAAPTDR